ncbi:hypothetical protein [Vibrio sp. Isolate25]|nr:hypothetical protein [Vibrio sp. Isolate25]
MSDTNPHRMIKKRVRRSLLEKVFIWSLEQRFRGFIMTTRR